MPYYKTAGRLIGVRLYLAKLVTSLEIILRKPKSLSLLLKARIKSTPLNLQTAIVAKSTNSNSQSAFRFQRGIKSARQKRDEIQLRTPEKLPWLRLVTCLHRGCVFDLIVLKLSMEGKVSLSYRRYFESLANYLSETS